MIIGGPALKSSHSFTSVRHVLMFPSGCKLDYHEAPDRKKRGKTKKEEAGSEWEERREEGKREKRRKIIAPATPTIRLHLVTSINNAHLVPTPIIVGGNCS